ncbi:MAG: sigma-54-dependent Fis family transcriptional regulator [Bacteroidetes bacterium]|uniref:Sigma-54-dependent Fis family transcriptional regulator n=1 Tax=Candidatus Pullibacteroides excrementavium TaxID=2840905 RepID=A0A9D9DT05_9BACT|nr:sigma-54-dependent Fis family transcriptional regulator [Candidatus Pullibacteroides excrementavium]
MARILVADDEALIRSSLREILEYEGYEVDEAADGLQAWEILQKNAFDAVFCDIKMPGLDGVELLEKAMSQCPVAFIMISGHGDIDTAVDCIKKGAFDFIAKPLELNRILVSLKNALDKGRMEKRTRQLQRQVESKYRIVGSSGLFAEALEMADKVAPTDARVLIMGRNGTGKELVARRIHRNSQVGDGPFVEVNCAAIPSELIESELFGHEKGSFTSAVKQRKGSFEQAQDGTIFLDEIGDMSLSAQAKVLRALQENVIMRVGGEKPIEVNARVIAATNKDLEAEIAAGRFREDLYHRLSVIVIRVPDLKDHKEDIPELVRYFNEQVSAGMSRQPREFSPEAVSLLCAQPWPGNIRQLRNIIERLLILCPGPIGKEEVERYL